MSYPSTFFKRSILFLLSLFFLFGCGDDEAKSLSLDGVWNGEYDSVLTVTDATIDFGLYGGEIVERNDSLGYVVFRYTNAPSWAPGQSNRFNKLVWEKVSADHPAIIRYSEGYAEESDTTNSSGDFIAWPDAASVVGRSDIFAMYTYTTNY